MWIWIPHRAFTQPLPRIRDRLNAESARTSMYGSSENSVLFMQQFNQLHCDILSLPFFDNFYNGLEMLFPMLAQAPSDNLPKECGCGSCLARLLNMYYVS